MKRYLLILLTGVLSMVTSAAVTPRESTAPPEDGAVSWVWRQLTPTGPAPEPRALGSAIYDQVGGRVIVFGGAGVDGPLNDVWALDLLTVSWIRLEPAGNQPPPRFGHNAVYDPVARQMVIWAGQGSRFYNDTWTLDLARPEWHDVTPAVRPRARYGSASVFDPVARSLVMFAGFTSEAGRFQDTQAFEIGSSSWADLTPMGEKPEIRCLHTAALDRLRRRMVIFGGQRSGPLDDLWAFDLASRTWTRFNPVGRPSARFFSTSFVDGDGRFIIFGGFANNMQSNDTWAFDFSEREWSKLDLENAPPARDGMMGAYIENEDRFVIIGGRGAVRYNDVWELRRR